MKIALCLFGLPPMKNNKQYKVDNDLTHYCWYQNVIRHNNVDIFIHTWGKNDNEKLRRKYKPKKMIVEEEITFDIDDENWYEYYDCTANNMFLSQSYSAKKSVELKQQYEKKRNQKYDIVMMSRIDTLWLKPINLSKLSKNKFYIANWNQRRQGKGELGAKKNITTISRHYKKILDYWFIASSENIDKFSNLHDFIPKWIKTQNRKGNTAPSNHTLKRDYLTKLRLWHKVEFKYYEHHDFNIQRYFYKFKDNEKPIFQNLITQSKEFEEEQKKITLISRIIKWFKQLFERTPIEKKTKKKAKNETTYSISPNGFVIKSKLPPSNSQRTSHIKYLDKNFQRTKTNPVYVQKSITNPKYKHLLLREITWLIKLKNCDRVPKFISRKENSYIMTYVGKRITKSNLPQDWEKQIKEIASSLSDHNCYHNDIKFGEILVLNNKIHIIDFQWATSSQKELCKLVGNPYKKLIPNEDVLFVKCNQIKKHG